MVSVNSSGMYIPLFTVPTSGTFDFNQYNHIYKHNYCEYCNSRLENQAVRCSSCGAASNSYKVK